MKTLLYRIFPDIYFYIHLFELNNKLPELYIFNKKQKIEKKIETFKEGTINLFVKCDYIIISKLEILSCINMDNNS